jgi:hypothetical protein
MRDSWRRDRRRHVTDSLLSFWRRQFHEHDWFDRWLLRGEDPPDRVRVATEQEFRRCSRAWDVGAICDRLKIRSDSTFVLWLSRGQIPSIEWLKWLFGAPAPAGSFVVTAELRRLRSFMGKKSIAGTAGLHENAAWQWEQGKGTRGPIKAILAGEDPTKTDGWECLPILTKECMLKFAEAMAPDICCARANVSRSGYYAALRHAERCGVKEHLVEYLSVKGRYGSEGGVRHGLAAHNFFIPTPNMLRFRKEADRLAIQEKVWLLQRLPGFTEWFIDWVTPKSHRGRRYVVSSDPAFTVVESVPTDTRPDDVQYNSSPPPRRKGRCGRPKGRRMDNVVKREQKMLADWDQGKYSSKAEAGRAHGFHRSDASKLINAHEKERERSHRARP